MATTTMRAPQKENLWAFGTREIVYSAIGAALYGVLNWVFNNLQLPGTNLVSFRPPVAIPMFMGIVFGPLVGFFTGFFGNVLGDLLSGYGFFWHWDVGNGLMGMIPGLLPLVGISLARAQRNYVVAAVAAIVASLVSMAFPALLINPFVMREMDFGAAFATLWLPAAVPNAINGAILVPILLAAWNAYRARSGR